MTEVHPEGSTIPNPLRLLGLVRMGTGAWFVARGITTLRHRNDLLPQAERLLEGEMGATDAPLRSFLVLVLAGVLLLIGSVLIIKGLAWMRRRQVPSGGPAELALDEVVATLRHHELPVYASRPNEARWPFRRVIEDDLAELPQWRRDIVDRGVRLFIWSSVATILLAATCLILPLTVVDDLLGPFPLPFVIMLPLVTLTWAILVLLLIESEGYRAESVELPLTDAARTTGSLQSGRFLESDPLLTPPRIHWLGIVLGLFGIAVQCLLLWWWDLSLLSYPELATSILRHASAIAAGLFFLALGDRMLHSAAALLQRYRYDSQLVLIDDGEGGPIARAAGIRSESLGLTGPRHIVAAVGGAHVRDSALSTISSAGSPR